MDRDEEAQEAHKGLLQDENESNSDTTKSTPKPWKIKPTGQKWHLLFLYTINFSLTIGLIWCLNHTKIHDPTLDVFSPANHVVEYEDVVFYNGIQEVSPYQQQPPDDIVDELWNRLYRNTLPDKIDHESAKKLPNSTVVAPGSDGEGLVGLEIFHGLHCLNALRKSLWPERYPDYSVFQNGTRDEFWTTHHNHCIDRLRMNIMCAGNIGTIYWRWNETMAPPRWMINMETTHKCRNFDRILEWAVDHEYPGWDDHTPSTNTDGWV